MTTRSTDSQVRDYIITPMTATYSPPRGMENPQAALAQYMNALRPYQPEALQGGWIALVAAHERTTWPVPGEILKHVRDWIHSNVKVDTKPIAREDGKKDWKQHPEQADRAMGTRDGQMALQHGYGRILHDHVNRCGSLAGFDHAKAKGLDAEMRQQLTDMQRDGDGFGGAISTMGTNRLETEQQLRTTHLRKDAAE